MVGEKTIFPSPSQRYAEAKVESHMSLTSKESIEDVESLSSGLSSLEEPKKPQAEPVGPPDGGLNAWLKVLGSFFIFFNSWGPLLAFGCFENYYIEHFLYTSTPSDVSWVGTVAVFLLLFGGVISGPAFDHGFYRWLLFGGSSLIVFGLMMLSLSTTYWEVLLSQGICFGLGCGMLYIPSLAGVAVSFSKRRAFAMGLAMSGASIGGLIYPIILRQLLPLVGFGWSVRIMGLVALATFVLSYPCLLREIPPSSGKTRNMVDRAALTDFPFMAFAIGGFFVLFAYYIPFLYIPQFAESTGASQSLSFYLVAITNAGSFFGRIVAGLIADKLGPFRTLVWAQATAGLVLLTWMAVHNDAGMIVWTIFWGFFSGLLVSLPGAVVPSLCPSMGVIGTRMGMAWMVSAFGSLIGGPIGGAIVSNGRFWPMQLFSGIAMLVGASSCAVAWYSHVQAKKQSLSS